MSSVDYICPICLDSLYNPVEVEGYDGISSTHLHCSLTPCGHHFHTLCILEWLQKPRRARPFLTPARGPCPICNETVVIPDLIPENPLLQVSPVDHYIHPFGMLKVSQENAPPEEMKIASPREEDKFAEMGRWAGFAIFLGIFFWRIRENLDVHLPILSLLLIIILVAGYFIEHQLGPAGCKGIVMIILTVYLFIYSIVEELRKGKRIGTA